MLSAALGSAGDRIRGHVPLLPKRGMSPEAPVLAGPGLVSPAQGYPREVLGVDPFAKLRVTPVKFWGLTILRGLTMIR
jgi:hypothetical protein